ncbi:NmrA family NAD(P)-binding protein [Lentzea sp. E54]|uniref:NmrA family NAD(P)-binding protein n=1 Tax=Lentzea xerophila TaxID=3435883 RepID=UPI003DA5B3C0
MPTPSAALITGATGKQGGAVARALLRSGVPVRALVRDPSSEQAAALAALGAVLVRGDLDDLPSLKAALDGTRAVFSVQTPDLTDPSGDSEVRRGHNLVQAALAAGVDHVLHTSVSGAGTVDLDNFDDSRWGAHTGQYYRNKREVEDLVRAAGFPRWTILRPATFMENFLRPSFYFADMTSDRLLVAVDPDVRLPFVAVDDIGRAAAAVFAEPERFHRVELELAGDVLSFRAAAQMLSQAFGTTIELPASPDDVPADGPLAAFFQGQRYMSAHPAPAHPEFAIELGVATTPFRRWAMAHGSAGI